MSLNKHHGNTLISFLETSRKKQKCQPYEDDKGQVRREEFVLQMPRSVWREGSPVPLDSNQQPPNSL